MAITDIFWKTSDTAEYAGYDVHVIRNSKTTGQIRKALMLKSDTSAGTLSLDNYMTAVKPDTAVTAVTIKPSLKASLETSSGSGIYSVYNVQFNANDCTVTANPWTATSPAPAIPAYKLNFNFHVEITITMGSTAIKKYFRVHVHEDITRVWLTPDILTVHPSSVATSSLYPTGARFSVYALFSDNTIGDISYHPGYSWSSGNANVKIAGGPSPGTLQDGRIKIGPGTAPASTSVSITFANTAALYSPTLLIANRMVPGTVKIDNTWTAANQCVSPIGSKSLPASPSDVLNFLFISDGFLSNEGMEFELLAADAANHLQNDPIAEPWGMVSKEKINYWSLFLPSREKGASFMNEVFIKNQLFYHDPAFYTQSTTLPKTYTFNNTATPTDYFTIAMGMDDYIKQIDSYLKAGIPCPKFNYNDDPLVDPTTNPFKRSKYRSSALASGQLSLSALITKVGVPTPMDMAANDITAICNKWKDLYDGSINTGNTTSSIVHEDVYVFWLDMSNRRLLNERDTAFGIATGKKPKMEETLGLYPSSRYIGIHPFRQSRAAMDYMITALENTAFTPSSAAVPMGSQWITSGPCAPFVAILSSGTRQGGENYPEEKYLAASIKGEDATIYCEAVPNGTTYLHTYELSILPHPIPSVVTNPDGSMKCELSNDAKSIIAHEFAHSFKLGDEYSDYARDLNIYLSIKDDVKLKYKNLMLYSDTLAGSAMSGDNVKWRWLRIEAAGKLESAIGSSNGADTSRTYFEFYIPISHAYTDYDPTNTSQTQDKFKTGDLVRIRKKDLQDISATNPPANTTNQVPPAQYSREVQFETFFSPASPPSTVAPPSPLNDATKYIGVQVSVKTTENTTTPLNTVNFTTNDILVRLVDSKFKGAGKVDVTNNTVTGINTCFTLQFSINYNIIICPTPESNTWITRKVTAIANDNGLTIDGTAIASPISAVSYFVVPLNSYMELLHDSFRKAITSGNMAMTPVLSGPSDDTNLGTKVQAPVNSGDMKLFDYLDLPESKHDVVGLYHGAAGYNYGGYHATGMCKMRSRGLVGFCPVCSYAMVDAVDPSVHGKNNARYQKIYPTFKEK